eukprot:CFRG3132T1
MSLVCVDCHAEFGFFKRKVNCNVCKTPMCTSCRANASFKLKSCRNCVLVSKDNLKQLATSFSLAESLTLKELIRIAKHYNIVIPPYLEKPEFLALVWNKVISPQKVLGPTARLATASTPKPNEGTQKANGTYRGGNSTQPNGTRPSSNVNSSTDARSYSQYRSTSTASSFTHTSRKSAKKSPAFNTKFQSQSQSQPYTQSESDPVQEGIDNIINSNFAKGVRDMVTGIVDALDPSSSQNGPNININTTTNANTGGSTHRSEGGSGAVGVSMEQSRGANTTSTNTTSTNTNTSKTSLNSGTSKSTNSNYSGDANGGVGYHKNALYFLSDLRTEDDVAMLTIRQLKYVLQKQHVNYAGAVERSDLQEKVIRLVREQVVDKQIHSSQIDTNDACVPTQSLSVSVDKDTDMGSPAIPSNNTSTSNIVDEDADMCKICFDATANCVFLECGHLVTCVDCGSMVMECPICRQHITRRVHTFKG